jgi:hypothetical protein
MLLSVVSSVAAMLPGASADVLPPQAIETEHRLRENPQAFDRADQFCTGRSVGDACQMPGTALAGGGAGVCRNGIDSSRTRIDLRCERTAKVSLERGLPAEGFVLPAYFCENPEGAAIARSRGSPPTIVSVRVAGSVPPAPPCSRSMARRCGMQAFARASRNPRRASISAVGTSLNARSSTAFPQNPSSVATRTSVGGRKSGSECGLLPAV